VYSPIFTVKCLFFSLAACFSNWYTQIREKHTLQIMTLDEKLAISNIALDLLDAGDQEGYMRLMKTALMPSYLAKIYKEKGGVKQLIKSG